MAKKQIIAMGLRTASYMVVRNGEQLSDSGSLRFPLFVKPTDLGGGEGIDSNSVVYSRAELQAKVSDVMERYATDVLVEEYLSGREFSVALLKDEHSDNLHVMPIELTTAANAQGNHILGQSVKKLDQDEVFYVRDGATSTLINDFAVQAFAALGARDYGRIDIRMDAQGVPYFLEANLIPGLIEGYGYFPQACALNLNMSHESVILRIVELGLQRTTELPQELVVPFLAHPLPVI